MKLVTIENKGELVTMSFYAVVKASTNELCALFRWRHQAEFFAKSVLPAGAYQVEELEEINHE